MIWRGGGQGRFVWATNSQMGNSNGGGKKVKIV